MSSKALSAIPCRMRFTAKVKKRQEIRSGITNHWSGQNRDISVMSKDLGLPLNSAVIRNDRFRRNQKINKITYWRQSYLKLDNAKLKTFS
jgi:hypothetical protein